MGFNINKPNLHYKKALGLNINKPNLHYKEAVSLNIKKKITLQKGTGSQYK